MLKRWVNDHWYDFSESAALLEKLRNFINMIDVSGMSNAAKALSKLVETKVNEMKRKQTSPLQIFSPISSFPPLSQIEGTKQSGKIVFSERPPPPILLPMGQGSSGRVVPGPSELFLSFHYEELARQMTLIDSVYFRYE